MTREDIDNLEAGERLDSLISEKVMGIRWPGVFYDGHPDSHFYNRRAYSTSIADAWLVVEKLRQMQRTITLSTLGVLPDSLRWGCNVLRGVRQLETITQAVGDTAPLAICRAALKAIASHQQEGEAE